MSAEVGKEPCLFLLFGHCRLTLNKDAPGFHKLSVLTVYGSWGLRDLSVSHGERQGSRLAQRQTQVIESHLRKGLRGFLAPRPSQHGLCTSSIRTLRELVRNADSQAHPDTLNQNKIPRWLVSTGKFEEHRSSPSVCSPVFERLLWCC